MTAQLSFFDAQSQRDRILAALAANAPAWLAAVRAFAKEIAHREGTVTIDEVREALQSSGFPMPHEVGLDTRVFGAVFRCPDFLAVCQRPTRRAARIARSGVGASYVTVYRLTPAYRIAPQARKKDVA